MRCALLTTALLGLTAAGCNSDRLVLRTKVETRLDATPVNPSAGPVKPVVVQAGGARHVLDKDRAKRLADLVGPWPADDVEDADDREQPGAVDSEIAESTAARTVRSALVGLLTESLHLGHGLAPGALAAGSEQSAKF